MSVGDDLGVTPVRGKAVNLAEARAMQDARAAAGAWDNDNVHVHRGKSSRKKKRRSRGRSLPARREPHAMAGSDNERAMSVAGTPRRASQVRNSLSARKRTEGIFDSDVEDADDNAETGDDDMSELDGSSSGEDAAGAANHESKTPEPEKDEKTSDDHRLSLIATPASQRAQWESEDDEFIAGENTPTEYGDDDEEYEPSYQTDSSDDSHYERGGARGVGREPERALAVRSFGVGRGGGITFSPDSVQAGARGASGSAMKNGGPAAPNIEEVMEEGAKKPYDAEDDVGEHHGIRVGPIYHGEVTDPDQVCDLTPQF